MPILQAEPNLFPHDLFDLKDDAAPEALARKWWVLHSRPRQEKSLARELYLRGISFYLPLTARRCRVNGRVQTSHIPLFSSYVFLLAEQEQRIAALATGRVVRSLAVPDQAGLARDLRQINTLITSGAPITLEDRLGPGMLVEIRSGPLAGLKGKILRGVSGRRFIVSVDFIQQGASVLLDDFVLAKTE